MHRTFQINKIRFGKDFLQLSFFFLSSNGESSDNDSGWKLILLVWGTINNYGDAGSNNLRENESEYPNNSE